MQKKYLINAVLAISLASFSMVSTIVYAKHHQKAVAPKAAPAPQATTTQSQPVATAQTSFTPEQVKAMQSIIHDYIVQNPQILREASQALRNQEMDKMQSDTKSQIVKHTSDLLNIDQHFAIGNPKGDVVMVDVFDYQCGHCKAMGPTVNNLVKGDPKLQVIFMDWPIFGNDSIYAAKAAIVAKKYGKYQEMHDALFAADGALSSDKVLQIAKSIGLDEKKFLQDMNDKATDDVIKSNAQLAKDLKLIATPAFIFINRQGSKVEFVLGEVGADDLVKAIGKVRGK